MDPEHLLDALLDALPDQVAFTDPQGRFLRINRAYAERLGLPDPAAAAGKSAFDLLPQAEAETLVETAAQAQRAGAALPVREICVGVAGEDRWYSIAVAPLGPGRGAVTIARDITRWKRTESQQRDAIAMYESLVENLPMNVFRKDREGRFQFVNNLLFKTLGIRREDMLGKTDHDFSPRELADKYRADDLRVMQTGESFMDIEQHNPRDGDPVYIQVFKAPVRNAAGEVIGTQGFFVDVTPLKRTEADLVKKSSELELAFRALEENQEKLLIAEKMASLGRLTAGIAHEMNTPLAAVRSALVELEALADEYRSSVGDAQVEPEDHGEIAREMLKTIRLAASAAKRAAGFVQGIKSHTRDMAPKQREAFNAAAVIDETLLLLTHALRKGHCSAGFEHDGGAFMLHGAPGRLGQVVTNLVNNAIDACATKGGGLITVRLGRDEGAVLLEVEDRGSGIPPEVVKKIFDPMFTTKRFGEGTGLGLTIVHDIVTGEFGGTIDVRTELGQGTTFVVRLPEPQEPHGA
jgi:PAS domain S-box-containing protein